MYKIENKTLTLEELLEKLHQEEKKVFIAGYIIETTTGMCIKHLFAAEV